MQLPVASSSSIRTLVLHTQCMQHHTPTTGNTLHTFVATRHQIQADARQDLCAKTRLQNCCAACTTASQTAKLAVTQRRAARCKTNRAILTAVSMFRTTCLPPHRTCTAVATDTRAPCCCASVPARPQHHHAHPPSGAVAPLGFPAASRQAPPSRISSEQPSS